MQPLVQIEELINAIKTIFDVDKEEILGHSRKAHIVRGRQVLVFCLRTKYKLSFPAIAKILNQDHTTVMYAYKKILNDQEMTQSLQYLLDEAGSANFVGKDRAPEKENEDEPIKKLVKKKAFFRLPRYNSDAQKYSFPITFNRGYLSRVLDNFSNNRQRDFIIRRYDFFSGRFTTLEEIANDNHITRERVRQIINKGINIIYRKNVGGAGQIIYQVEDNLSKDGIYSLNKIIKDFFIYSSSADEKNLEKYLIMIFSILPWVKQFELSGLVCLININKEKEMLESIDRIKSIIKQIDSLIPDTISDKWPFIYDRLRTNEYFNGKRYLLEDDFLRACYDNYLFEEEFIIYKKEGFKKYKLKGILDKENTRCVPNQYSIFFK